MPQTPLSRSLITDQCPICHQAVYADEGYYSTTGAHALCQERSIQEFRTAVERADKMCRAITGRPLKRIAQRPRGYGAPTLRLKELARSALEDYFGASVDGDVNIYVNAPVWNQARFDVMRFTGSVKIGGLMRSFGSWNTVTELVRHKKLNVTDASVTASGGLELSPGI